MKIPKQEYTAEFKTLAVQSGRTAGRRLVPWPGSWGWWSRPCGTG